MELRAAVLMRNTTPNEVLHREGGITATRIVLEENGL